MNPPRRAAVAEALASLSERERLVLALSRIDGLEASEIACLVGGSEAAAARALAGAERKLAQRAGAARNAAADPRTTPGRARSRREEDQRWRA